MFIYNVNGIYNINRVSNSNTRCQGEVITENKNIKLINLNYFIQWGKYTIQLGAYDRKFTKDFSGFTLSLYHQ